MKHLPKFYITQGVLVSLIVFIGLGFLWLGLKYISPDKTCSSFITQLQAQQWSDSHNHVLDRNGDGIACNALLK